MKSQNLGMLLSSLFLIAQRLFAPAYSRVLGATAGRLTASGSGTDAELEAEALGAETPRATLGALVANIIEANAASDPLQIICDQIDSNSRLVRTFPVSHNAFTGGAAILDILRELDGDTELQKVSAWSVGEGANYDGGNPAHVALMAAVIPLLETRLPRYSLASLISKLEDLKDGDGERLISALVVDQSGDGILNVATNPNTAGSALVAIDQDISPVTESDVSPLPFE